jgi:hypothetical protein
MGPRSREVSEGLGYYSLQEQAEELKQGLVELKLLRQVSQALKDWDPRLLPIR